MRDIRSSPPMPSVGSWSPDATEHFAANLFGARSPIAHQAAAGAQDGDAEPIEHGPQIFPAGIDAAAGLAHALDPANNALTFRAVLHEYAEYGVRFGKLGAFGGKLAPLLAGLVLADLKIVNEPFVLEHLRQVRFYARRRQFEHRPFDASGVANSREH